MNRSLADVGGGLLIVSRSSRSTGDCRATARASRTLPGPETAIPLYEVIHCALPRERTAGRDRHDRRGYEGRSIEHLPVTLWMEPPGGHADNGEFEN